MCKARFAWTAVCLLCAFAWAADWPQWLGPNRNGVTSEPSGWPKGWPPKRLWTKNVGLGCTSPCIVKGKLYVMGWHGEGRRTANTMGTDTVYCLDARTGREIWKQSYPARYQSRVRTGDVYQYGGPSSTPTFDPETQYLYTLSVDGDFRCWDIARGGKPVWSKNFYDEFKVPQRPRVSKGRRDYGFTSSPLIQGDTVIVEVGSDEGTIVAFDKRTGRRLWASALKGPAGHTGGPAPITLRGASGIATLTLFKLVVMRTDPGHEGETVAQFPWATDFGCNIATPAVAGNNVLITSGYNHRKASLIEISETGARLKWTSKYYGLVSTPVIHKGRVYLIAGPLACLDWRTGRRLWRGGNFGHGSCLITADDKMIAFGNNKLALIDARPSARKYRELYRVSRVGRHVCYPHVCLSDGFICCKDRAGYVECFSVRGNGGRK